MKTGNRILTGLLVMALGGFAWLVLSQPRQPPEPVYHGKRLSDWLQNYFRPSKFVGQLPDLRETAQAVRQIGTNGIPTLSRMLRARDPGWKLWLIALVQKQHVIKIHFVPAFQQRLLAIRALDELGRAAAKGAVPALIEMYETSPDVTSRLAAVDALGKIGSSPIQPVQPTGWGTINQRTTDPDPLLTQALVPPLLRGATNASSAELRVRTLSALARTPADRSIILPVMVNALKDSSASVRNFAVFVFMSMPAEPNLAGLVVPALTNVLADPAVPTEYIAEALANYGPYAKPAVPALLNYIKEHPDRLDTRTYFVVESLKRIDPEAAAKAGVK